jgi:Domain of unknown function (DUF4388)
MTALAESGTPSGQGHCLVVARHLPRAYSHASLIGAAGWSATIAVGGLHALTQIEREHPRLILIDPTIDDLSAAELHEILRDDPASRDTLVLISGETLPPRYGEDNDILVPPGLSSAEHIVYALRAIDVNLAPGWLDAQAAALSGDLSDLPLPDILMCLQDLKLSGLLLLHFGAQAAQIIVQGGEIIDAEYAQASPLESVADLLLSGHDGTFRFHALSPQALASYPRQITVSTQHLLMEAAVEADHRPPTPERPHAGALPFDSVQFDSTEFDGAEFDGAEFNNVPFDTVQFDTVDVETVHADPVQPEDLTLETS